MQSNNLIYNKNNLEGFPGYLIECGAKVTSPFSGTIAIGMSVAPPSKSSSCLSKSTTILSPTLPTEIADTKFFIWMPACANAIEAAHIPAHLVPAFACTISMNTSTTVLGNFFKSKTGNNDLEVTREISEDLLDGPGLFLSGSSSVHRLLRI